MSNSLSYLLLQSCYWIIDSCQLFCQAVSGVLLYLNYVIAINVWRDFIMNMIRVNILNSVTEQQQHIKIHYSSHDCHLLVSNISCSSCFSSWSFDDRISLSSTLDDRWAYSWLISLNVLKDSCAMKWHVSIIMSMTVWAYNKQQYVWRYWYTLVTYSDAGTTMSSTPDNTLSTLKNENTGTRMRWMKVLLWIIVVD